MKIGEQAMVLGSAFAGGMSQSYLIRKYPTWSWLLSLGLIGGGIFLGTKPGWKEKVGLGIATSGASGLGTAIIPVGAAAPAGGVRRQLGTSAGLAQRMLTAGQDQRAALGFEAKTSVAAGSHSNPGARIPEFEELRQF